MTGPGLALVLMFLAAASLGAQPNRAPGGQSIRGRPPSLTKYKNPDLPRLAGKDTVTVRRLHDGTCAWYEVRVRQGLASGLGERDDSRCWGIVYYTGDPLAYQRAPRPDSQMVAASRGPRYPPNIVDVDTITVRRWADGKCFWRNFPLRKARPGISAMLVETDELTCRGVVYYARHGHTAEDFKRLASPSQDGSAH